MFCARTNSGKDGSTEEHGRPVVPVPVSDASDAMMAGLQQITLVARQTYGDKLSKLFPRVVLPKGSVPHGLEQKLPTDLCMYSTGKLRHPPKLLIMYI